MESRIGLSLNKASTNIMSCMWASHMIDCIFRKRSIFLKIFLKCLPAWILSCYGYLLYIESFNLNELYKIGVLLLFGLIPSMCFMLSALIFFNKLEEETARFVSFCYHNNMVSYFTYCVYVGKHPKHFTYPSTPPIKPPKGPST